MRALASLGLALIVSLLASPKAQAAPVARVLRVDPSLGASESKPQLTVLFDLSEPQGGATAVAHCGTLTGPERLSCESDALERPDVAYRPATLPEGKVVLTVSTPSEEFPARLGSHRTFAESADRPGMGTAWLVILDADEHGSDGLPELTAVASELILRLAPRDQLNLAVLGSENLVSETGWLTVDKWATDLSPLKSISIKKGRSRTRPLAALLRSATQNGFATLPKDVAGHPLIHHAVVVLSSGFGGGDPATTGPGADELRNFLTRGQFAQEGANLPKMPLPVIAVATPPKGYPEHAALAREFMQGLANPEIGGFFTNIQKGELAHAKRIVDTVRARFARMIVAQFELGCLAPSPRQSLALLFPGANPPIVGDSSFRDVPVAWEPQKWPLDVDAALTRRKIDEQGGIFPSGTIKVFGRFCWGGDLSRPEVYFVPPGETLPSGLTDESSVQATQKHLIGLDMRGQVTAANELFAEFTVPDSDRLLHGSGHRQVARLVVVDRLLHRTSGLTDATVLEVKAKPKPIPTIWYLAGGSLAILVLSALVTAVAQVLKRRSTALATYSGIRVEGSPYVAPGPAFKTERKSGTLPTRAVLVYGRQRFTVLPSQELTVGRDTARAVAVLVSPQVSGIHATFQLEGGRLFVRDERSTSGTWFRGRRIAPGESVALEVGDEVTLGTETIRVDQISS